MYLFDRRGFEVAENRQFDVHYSFLTFESRPTTTAMAE